jgi:hypothetical protein
VCPNSLTHRCAVLVLTDTLTLQLTDVNATNTPLDTRLNDVCRETVEEMTAALRPLVVKDSSFFATAVVTDSDF